MPEYKVGTVYHVGKTQWNDGSDFNYRSGMLELRLFFSKLTDNDIKAIRNGSCNFYIATTNQILWFLFEFGMACPLSDNSYSWWLVPENERTIPQELEQNEMLTLTIILVSSEDGIIRALRQIKLSHNFSKQLFDAIREQTKHSFNPTQHDLEIARMYSKYPTTESMLSIVKASCTIESSNQQN